MDKSALKNIKLFLFDQDGTLYLGNRLYPFTIEMLETIKQNGAKYMFVTNNSSKSVNDYIKKLAKLGITAEQLGLKAGLLLCCLFPLILLIAQLIMNKRKKEC